MAIRFLLSLPPLERNANYFEAVVHLLIENKKLSELRASKEGIFAAVTKLEIANESSFYVKTKGSRPRA